MTLAVFPLQREATPSCWVVRRKHSTIPSYFRSRRPDLSISSCLPFRQYDDVYGVVAHIECDSFAMVVPSAYRPCVISVPRAEPNMEIGDEAHRKTSQKPLGGLKLTWFWIRSLTRSMGAAAVFETAAETPPTAVEVSVCNKTPYMGHHRPSSSIDKIPQIG